jgi:hypothetical protein
MAMVQLKCPETGKPIYLGEVPPDAHIAASLWSRPITCPHCGANHPWTSGHFALAMKALHDSPGATRVLVDSSGLLDNCASVDP